MNESDFEAKLGNPLPESETHLKVSGSGKFFFSKQRIFGVLHFVKKPAPDFDGDPQVLESLRKEFSIGLHLNHPGVVRYINFDGKALYEEFIDGQNLRDLINKGDARLQDKEFVQNLITQLFETVSYLHQEGVLHLDLKPENILIPRIGNQSKIIDFGCAFNSQNDSTQGFTPAYKAPEQGKTQSDCRTDIYQLGLIVKELVKSLNQKGKWRQFINKTIAENPDNRFQSAEKALQALNKIIHKKRFPVLPVFGMLLAAIITAGAVIFYFKFNVPQQIPVLPPAVVEKQKPQESDNAINQINTESAETKNSQKDKSETSGSESLVKSSTSENIESKIKKEVQSKIASLYKKYVAPHLNESSSDDSRERFKKIQDGFQQCQSEAFQLMEKLQQKYPSQSDYIESEVTSQIERQQIQAMFRYEQTQNK
ncbi:MAG: protein kinase [Muribaculaceae bacterium]|nr:protein kinase [Muribaculaceae bacterium]